MTKRIFIGFICLDLFLALLLSFFYWWNIRQTTNIPHENVHLTPTNVPYKNSAPNIQKWNLIFDDEFSGASLDTT